MNPRDARQVSAKLYAEEPVDVDPAALIRVFHGWIRNEVLPDRIMIDVADYSHVPEGPGVILICHEAHYSFDDAGGRPGLRCTLKRHGYREERDPIDEALLSALRACALLQAEPELGGKLRFKTDELYFGVEDRLVAPNTDETFRTFNGRSSRGWRRGVQGPVRSPCYPWAAPRNRSAQVSVPSPPPLNALLERLESSGRSSLQRSRHS